MSAWWQDFMADFRFVFLENDRWQLLFQGLGNTLVITFFAVLIGIGLGAVVATVRTTYDKNQEDLKKRNPVGYYVLYVCNLICQIYLTVIRGTPVVVQLMISYFIIFAASNNSIAVAIFAFGINSGAYVAEIFRSGIMSIDKGQMEAGRSLGLGYAKTMQKIILPQAIKNVLPALVNEMITLLKETSICGYIGLNELTRGGDIIRGVTFEALLPLLVVAAIYLAIVMFFTWVMGKLERRLRESDNR